MKKIPKEYTNEEYFEYLEEVLYLLIRRIDGFETISKVQSKLKDTDLEIYNNIVAFYCSIQMVKIKYKEVLSKQTDFNEIRKLKDSKVECESLFSQYLESVDQTIFLGSISEITYWVTKTEGARQLKIHRDFLTSWLEWHKYLENKNKNKLKGQQTKEKLRVILGDKIDDFEKIEEEYQENIERFKAGKENIFINIDQEIDIEKSVCNDSLILPEKWLGEKQDFRVIEEHTKCVVEENKTLSLKEYYEKIKGSINEEWLTNKDLLKQVITIYLIKRCQNGDEEAFNTLFSLFEEKTQKITKKYIKERGKLIKSDEVEGRGLSILASLLKGDNPTNLYKALEQNRLSKNGIDYLNKKPYTALNESYEYMFGVINNQYNHLNNILNDLQKKCKDLRNRSKTAKKIQTKKDYYNEILSSSSDVLSKINSAPTLFALLNPIDLLKISPSYNKYLFKPAPNINLTVWLFGNKDKTYHGKIWASLCDLFDNRKQNWNETFADDEFACDKSGIYHKITPQQEDD